MHHATYYRDHYRSNYSDNVYTQNVGIHPQPVSFNAYFSLESASFNDSTSAFNGDYEDFQNFTVENDFQDTKMQLPSLNSSFNSFNSCKMKTSRDFSHPAFDPSQERHRHSPPGRKSFQQMEWENRKIRGMKYDVNEYLGYGDGQVNQHDRHVGKNATEHHGSAENQDYSISLTAQADDSWGSWSSISDRSRLCWVHDDGESLPKYPLSPSPPPFRTPYSVAAVRPQHTRSHPDLFEQNERDGSCYGSSLRSCGLVNSRLWPPPLPALDHLAAPRRWDDLADGYRPSTPELQTTFDVTLAGRPRPQSGPACHKQPTVAAARWTCRAKPPLQDGEAFQIDSDVVLALPPPPQHLRAASSPTIGGANGAAAEMRSSAKGPLRPAIRDSGRVQRTRLAEAAMVPEQAALRAAFGEMVRGRRNVARSWLRARALALAGGGDGLDSEDRRCGPGGAATKWAVASGVAAPVPRATSPGGRAEHSALTSGKGEHSSGGDVDGEHQTAPTWKGPELAKHAAKQEEEEEEEGEEGEEEEEADPPPCGCVPFGRPASPSVAGSGGAGAGTLLRQAARRLSAAVRG